MDVKYKPSDDRLRTHHIIREVNIEYFNNGGTSSDSSAVETNALEQEILYLHHKTKQYIAAGEETIVSVSLFEHL